LLVTVPIGAWVASVVFDIVSMVTDEDVEIFAGGAYWLIAIGVLGALVAALFGLMDLLVIPRGTKAFRTALTHMAFNLTVVALFAVSFIGRANTGYEDKATTWEFVVSLVALALLAVSGWLGGKLAYRYGVRVADEADQAEGYR
jgi:uncharacterized membrane protein